MKNKVKNESSFFDKMISFVAKLGNQRELSAIRDGFALMLPIIIAGAIGILGTTFLFGGWGAESSSILGWIAKVSGGIRVKSEGVWEFVGDWKTISINGVHVFMYLNSATFGFFSFYTAIVIGYVYSKSLGSTTPLLGGLVALMSFLICGGRDVNFTNANGLLPAILISLTATYIYVKLSNVERLKVKMPSGVPPAVGRAFSALFPMIIVGIIFGIINYIFWVCGYYGDITILNKDDSVMVKAIDQSFISMFYKGVTSPFLTFVGSKNAGLGIMLIYLLFVGFFWWCGIHGSNLLNGIFYPIWFGLITSNAVAVADSGSYQAASDAGLLSIANWAFIEQFAMITGWGLTGMLVLASIIFSKNAQWRKVNTIAGPASIFNINEPVTYGYPIMLNLALLIPTILAGPIAGSIGYMATWLGWMRICYIYVPWPLPAPIGGVLSTGIDWRAVPVIFASLITMLLIYIPFVLADNKIQKRIAIKIEKDKTEEENAVKNKPEIKTTQ